MSVSSHPFWRKSPNNILVKNINCKAILFAVLSGLLTLKKNTFLRDLFTAYFLSCMWETRPDQTRPDQTRPQQTIAIIACLNLKWKALQTFEKPETTGCGTEMDFFLESAFRTAQSGGHFPPCVVIFVLQHLVIMEQWMDAQGAPTIKASHRSDK